MHKHTQQQSYELVDATMPKQQAVHLTISNTSCFFLLVDYDLFDTQHSPTAEIY